MIRLCATIWLLNSLVFSQQPLPNVSMPPLENCNNPDAFTMSCLNQKTQNIPPGGDVKRHEEILIDIVQVSGACSYTIPEFIILIIPPDISYNPNKMNWAKAKVIYSNPSQHTKHKLPKFTIKGTGRVTIETVPIELKHRKKLANEKSCQLNVVYAKPEVTLLGGAEELYPANTKSQIKCIAYNLNNEDQSERGLTFRWQCSVMEGSAPNFCNPNYMANFNDKNMLIIPAVVAKFGNIFTITVEVGLKEASEYKTRSTQKIFFHDRAGRGTLKIECVKNCKPKSKVTLSSMNTILKAICTNCVPNVNIKWYIRDSKGRDSVDYKYLKSREGFDFYLQAGALKDNEMYRVKAEEIDVVELALWDSFDLHTKVPPPVKDCKIDPNSGVAFETGFQIKCVYFPGDMTFEIIAIKNKKRNLISKTNDLERELFMLPAGVSILLNVNYKLTGYTQSIKLKVEVKECLDLSNKNTNAEINEAVNEKLKDVTDLIKDSHANLALQGLAAIVNEYANLPLEKENLKKSLDQAVIDVISQVNLDSPTKAQQVADTLSQIAERYNVSDPEISTQATEICSRAGNVLLNEAKYAENPELMRDQIKHSVRSLSICSQAGLNENKDSVEPTNSSVTVPDSEEFPLIPTEQPLEFYPDYTNDEHSSDNKAKFEKNSKSMKKICFTNGKMLAYTMVPEEDPVIAKHQSLTIAVARLYCNDTPFRIIETPDVTVKPTTDCFSENIPILDILICSTRLNPFWYIDNITLITPIVYVAFSGRQDGQSGMGLDLIKANKESKGFKDPFHIRLPTNEKIKLELLINEAPLPDESIATLNENSFYEKISTHRIFVYKNRGFTISFQNMTSTDMYDILVNNFEKPTYQSFNLIYQTITANNNIVDVTQISNYDSFWYLSLLPNENMKSAVKKYAFTVTTTGCYSWNIDAKQWDYACHAAAGHLISRNITCYCTFGRVFTGYVINNKVTLEENLILDFELKLNFCWVIYLTVMVTFFLFTLLLFLCSFEQNEDILDKVFFLGDVPSFYQYAYVIVVKTGLKRHSGTTSNVSIKLHGTEGDSLEHVINYPDPHLAMLQRGTENWFVLACEKSLGDLKQIEIWFDSIGNNTKWLCSKIDIYDIQNEQFWTFILEEWFDVTLRDHDKFIFTVTKDKKNKKMENKSRRILASIKRFLGKIKHQVNLWNLFSTDPLLTRKERVSLIFSVILLLYLVIMILYSIPNFDKTDVIDPNQFGFHHKLFWTPIVGSIATFLFHVPFIYFIKKGKFLSLNTYKLKRFTIRFTSNCCWITIGLICLFIITLLIICGFWIPMDTSLLWLVSSILGILFNIFVLQNVFGIAYSYFVRLPAQMQFINQNLIEYIELQRVWIYKRFGALGLRPYLSHLYVSLDSITLKERFKWEEIKMKIKEILEDLIMISLYVTLLYIVLMIDREPQAINSHEEIKKLVTGKVIHNEMNVRTVHDIEYFTSNVLLPSIQTMQWYGKFIQDNPGMTKDFSNKYLGVLRLRQHRTKEIQCQHSKLKKILKVTCRPDLNVLMETESFSRGWMPETDISNITTERMAEAWRFIKSKGFSDTPPYFGEYGVYPGGGYIAPLGRNFKNSLINLDYLKKYKWLDSRTRVVFIEFLTYNQNVNIFNSVTLAFEIGATGHVETSLKLQTRKFLVASSVTRKVLYTGFIIMLLVLLIKIVFKLIKKKHKYFYEIWEIFDILIVFLSGISILLYFIRSGHIFEYISVISEASNNEFVNYFHLFAADSTLTAISATLVFVATLRLWKLLRFLIIVKITEKTLKDSAIPLLVCLIFQMVYMIAFTVAGSLLFGAYIKEFRNLHTSFITLLLLGIGEFVTLDAYNLSQQTLGAIFYILYMLFSIFFLTTYVAIVSIHYGEAKDFYADEPGFVQKYLKEKWIYYKSLMLVRLKKLRGGQDPLYEDLIIMPTSGRYDNCYAIAKSRLDAMALISMCVLRNLEDKGNFNDQDFELMSKMLKSLFSTQSSEKEIFFAVRDPPYIKLVDDRKIIEIANICERFIKDCLNHTNSRKFQKPWIEERILRINNLIDNVKLIEKVLNNIQITFK